MARARRASSLSQAVNYASNPPANDPLAPATGLATGSKSGADRKVATTTRHGGFLYDLRTFNWMRNPVSSLKIIVVFLSAWAGWFLLLPKSANPLDPLVRISYPLPRLLSESQVHYDKGLLDILFLCFYVVVFAFTRQAFTEWIVRPFGKWHGIRSEGKLLRLMEQGYTFAYFSVSGAVGIYVMSDLPIWWYKTEQFWHGHPHWRMLPQVKIYYLLQFSYWLQQMLVLVMRLEKPRPDFKELVIHHFVTLWLIGWSYTIHLTYIGVAIFVTMDISDAFLALSKSINYLKYQRTSEFTFAIFLVVWTYLRHYLNLKILWSVYTEWEELIPANQRFFRPRERIWMAPWMKWQIFIPIALIQLLNIFWYFLIWRILIRMLRGNDATDIREEDEDEEEDTAQAKKSK